MSSEKQISRVGAPVSVSKHGAPLMCAPPHQMCRYAATPMARILFQTAPDGRPTGSPSFFQPFDEVVCFRKGPRLGVGCHVIGCNGERSHVDLPNKVMMGAPYGEARCVNIWHISELRANKGRSRQGVQEVWCGGQNRYKQLMSDHHPPELTPHASLPEIPVLPARGRRLD